jgi:phage gp46-like protein
VTDLALVPRETSTDLAVVNNDLLADDGLETAVILSLFTDRRAGDDDVMPFGQTDRRGWFGDAVPVVQGDRIGSRLWMLNREKQTAEVLAKAKEYAVEALAWLVEDKVASAVEVETIYVSQGVLGIAVVIYKPQIDPVRFDFNYTWAAQAVKRG